ncbi:MAG: hypothetical protein KA473_15895 [Anaerolineales bacterium]|nr:hypothetical protein [Anaerolineales bacterium]MBP6210914.1 hypothetical protein [Anaerolineales bacterium]
MNQKSRFIIAIIVAVVLLATAAGAWAAPRFAGTVPEVPSQVPAVVPLTGGQCLDTIDMETAVFARIPDGCLIVVEAVAEPDKTYAPAPEGKAFVGDTFKVTANPVDALVRVCYAYPPEFADKEAKIYKLNETASPMLWDEIPGAVIENGTICVESVAGVFSLIGNQ